MSVRGVTMALLQSPFSFSLMAAVFDVPSVMSANVVVTVQPERAVGRRHAGVRAPGRDAAVEDVRRLGVLERAATAEALLLANLASDR